MKESCEGQRNKAGTVTEKKSIFEHHLRVFLGPLRLDEIDVGAAIQSGNLRDARGALRSESLAASSLARALDRDDRRTFGIVRGNAVAKERRSLTEK